MYHGIGNSPRNEALDIVIEDDVWIGYDCIVLPGAHTGKGSVIGARSVVTGNIPPYSIYVGNKVIKKRFSDEIVDLIADIDFSRIEHRAGDAYEQFCMQRVNPKNISEIKKTFAE